MKVNGNPIKLMDMMPRINCLAPTLGQHNEEIFGGFGYTAEQIEEFRTGALFYIVFMVKKIIVVIPFWDI